MSFVWDDQRSPRPDTHGIPSHPLDSTDMVLPYGDQHGQVSYPIDSTGIVIMHGDSHEGSMDDAMHPGQPKPGSWKEVPTVQPGTAKGY